MTSLSRLSIKEIEDKEIPKIFDILAAQYSAAKNGEFSDFTDMDDLENWAALFVSQVIERGRVCFSSRLSQTFHDLLVGTLGRIVTETDIVNLPQPYPEMLYAGKTHGIVSVNPDLSHRQFYRLISNSLIFGFVRFNKREEIEIGDLPATYQAHRVAKEDAAAWWGELDYLNYYAIRDFVAFNRPVIKAGVP